MTPWQRRRYVTQEIAARYAPGVDYGAEGKVLLRTQFLRVVWRKGHMGWGGVGMGQRYYEAGLYIEEHFFKTDRHGYRIGQPLNLRFGPVFKGGRLTRQQIENHLDDLRSRLGLPSLEAIDLRLDRTCVVPRVGKPKKGRR